VPKPSSGRSELGLHNAANAPHFLDAAQQLPCDWIFSVSAAPVLIVDARSTRIVEGNPAAVGLFRTTRSNLLGSLFLDVFDLRSAERLRDSFATLRNGGSADAVALRTASGNSVRVRLSLLEVISESYFLVHPTACASDASEGSEFTSRSSIYRAVDDACLGFVVSDSSLRIEYANRAFLKMAGLNSQHQVIGEALARWLTLSEAHLENLARQISSRQAVGQLTTIFLAERNSPRGVEVSTVSFPDGAGTGWAFCVQEMGSLN
jgi:PAS domain-containing protein